MEDGAENLEISEPGANLGEDNETCREDTEVFSPGSKMTANSAIAIGDSNGSPGINLELEEDSHRFQISVPQVKKIVDLYAEEPTLLDLGSVQQEYEDHGEGEEEDSAQDDYLQAQPGVYADLSKPTTENIKHAEITDSSHLLMCLSDIASTLRPSLLPGGNANDADKQEFDLEESDGAVDVSGSALDSPSTSKARTGVSNTLLKKEFSEVDQSEIFSESRSRKVGENEGAEDIGSVEGTLCKEIFRVGQVDSLDKWQEESSFEGRPCPNGKNVSSDSVLDGNQHDLNISSTSSSPVKRLSDLEQELLNNSTSKHICDSEQTYVYDNSRDRENGMCVDEREIQNLTLDRGSEEPLCENGHDKNSSEVHSGICDKAQQDECVNTEAPSDNKSSSPSVRENQCNGDADFHNLEWCDTLKISGQTDEVGIENLDGKRKQTFDDDETVGNSMSGHVESRSSVKMLKVDHNAAVMNQQSNADRSTGRVPCVSQPLDGRTLFSGNIQANSQISDYAQYLGLQPTVKFKCVRCGVKDFPSMMDLKTHQYACLKSHTSSQPNPSPAPFTPQSSSTNFRITRKVYLCSVCGTYYENWNLFLHMRDVHKRHICLFCLGMFSQAERLAAHLVAKHNIVEGHYGNVEEFRLTCKGSVFLMCCSCEKVFSEGDSFSNHPCKDRTLAVKPTTSNSLLVSVKNQTSSLSNKSSSTPEKPKPTSKQTAPVKLFETKAGHPGKGSAGKPKQILKVKIPIQPKKLDTTPLKASKAATLHPRRPSTASIYHKNGLESIQTGMTGADMTATLESLHQSEELSNVASQPSDPGPMTNLDRTINAVALGISFEALEWQQKKNEEIEEVRHLEEPPPLPSLDGAVKSDSDSNGPSLSNLEGEGTLDAVPTTESPIEEASEIPAEEPERPLLSNPIPETEPQRSDPETPEPVSLEQFSPLEGIPIQQPQPKILFDLPSASHLPPLLEEHDLKTVPSTAPPKPVPTERAPAEEVSDIDTDDSDKLSLVVDETGSGAEIEEKPQESVASEATQVANPVKELPRGETPCEGSPREESPREESPREESPREETPREESPHCVSPRRESPREKSPREKSPREESPREESPREESPCEDPVVDEPCPDKTLDIPLAGEDVPICEVRIEEPLEDIPIQALLKECVKALCYLCVYCSHARRIAVNGKQLALHTLAEHRFCPIDGSDRQDYPPTVRFTSRLKKSVHILQDMVFNTDTYDSADKSSCLPYDRTYECFHCHFFTRSHKELYIHNRKMHQKTILLCIMCKSNFYSYSELLCHLCPGIYIPQCNIGFHCCMCDVDNIPSAFRLMVHLRKKHHACDVCLEVTGDQQKLSSHVWKHKLHHLCYRCGIAYRNKPDITNHLFWKHGTESVLCKKCLQKKWPHVYHFCVPPATFTCDECNSLFTRAVSLRVHKRIHTGEQPHPCTECEEKFISKKLLAKHTLIHRTPVPEETPQIDAKNVEDETGDRREDATQVEKEEAKETSDLERDDKDKKHSKKKKYKEEQKKKVVDVYDLPPLNLSSESDSSDDEAPMQPPPPTSEPIPEPAEETQPAQVVDGIWDKFQNYQANLDKREKIPTPEPHEDPNEVAFKIVMMDHDYCAPNKPPEPVPEPEVKEEEEEKIEAPAPEPVEKVPEIAVPEVNPPLTPPHSKDDSKVSSESPSKRKRSPKKKTKRRSSSSSSNSSSGSSSSSCSCGTNCSCSSSSSSDSSSSSSDSDSSSSEGRRRALVRRELRKERALEKKKEEEAAEAAPAPAPTEEVHVDVMEAEPAFRESDLDTTETDTDEDFYDERPQKLPDESQVEKRNLMLLASLAPLNNGSTSPTPLQLDVQADLLQQQYPVPQLNPAAVTAKKKTKKRKKKQSHFHARFPPPDMPPSTLSVPDSLQSVPMYYPSASSPVPSTQKQPLTPSFQQATPEVNSKRPLITKLSREVASTPGSGSETEGRTKRKRMPNKFYGYSSDEDTEDHSSTQKWRKTETTILHTPPPVVSTIPRIPVSPLTLKRTVLPAATAPPITLQLSRSLITKADSDSEESKRVTSSSSSTDSDDDAMQISEGPPSTTLAAPVRESNDNLYCYCQCPYDEVSEMIACDGKNCAIEWFHFECVGIMVPPKGQWYCPDCRKHMTAYQGVE